MRTTRRISSGERTIWERAAGGQSIARVPRQIKNRGHWFPPDMNLCIVRPSFDDPNYYIAFIRWCQSLAKDRAGSRPTEHGKDLTEETHYWRLGFANGGAIAENLQEQHMALDFKRILCPVDLSPFSLGALKLAVKIAESAGARLYLLHVIDNPFDELYMKSITEADPALFALYQKEPVKRARIMRATEGHSEVLLKQFSHDW